MPTRAGSSGDAEKAANRLPSAASRTRSSCETAAPEIGGIGGAESRSKHMPRPYSAATRRSRSLSSFHQPTDARTSPRPGRSRTMTPASASRRDDVGRLLDGHAPRDERRALVGDDDVRPCLAQELAAALGHLGRALERPRPGVREIAARSPATCAFGVRFGSKRARSVLRHERPVRLVACCER